MDISSTSDSMARIAQMIGGATTANDVSMAVLKIAQNQTQQDGANAIQLVNSVTDGSLGHHFDARA